MSVEYLQMMPGKADEIMRKYFEQSRLCESHAALDHSSALCIQRRWRGFRDRRYLAFVSSQALVIQRAFRGHLGRVRARVALRQREQAALQSHFEAMATIIQKHVRGTQSRKYAQDIYARRAYIAQVARAGDALLSSSSAAQEEQLLWESAQAQERSAARFEAVTTNLHHLLSTKSIPSVFQSPVRGPEFEATAFDIPVEQHIKEAFKNRQTQLRKMRQHVFLPTSPSQAVVPAPPAAATAAAAAVAMSARADSSFSAADLRNGASSSLSSAAYFNGNASVTGSNASSRAVSTRPNSGGRLLAPLQQQQQQQQQQQPSPPPVAAAPSSSMNQTQVRARSSASSLSSPATLSAASSTSSLHSSSSRLAAQQHLQQQQQQQQSQPTQLLPSVRGASQSQLAGPASGRTLDAHQLYASKISGAVTEEKQQIPLALALNGHVSTTPTRSRAQQQQIQLQQQQQQQQQTQSLAATRTNITSSSEKRKWAQPTKPNIPLRAGL